MKKAMRCIRSNYILFGGCLTATECMRAAQVTRSTFYRYLNQMREEDRNKGVIWNDEALVDDINALDLTDEEIKLKIKNYYTKNIS